MMTDINDMLVFLSVVEAGSFTLAADKLDIPKANVSRKVSRLEQQLGVTLLERSTRSQHLTEAGRLFLGHCKRIQQEIDLANSEVSELLHSYQGELKVGASVAIGQQILQPQLSDFMNQYPDISIELQLSNARVDLIEHGFDMLIRIGKLDDSRLLAKRLGTIKRKLYASSAYMADKSRNINIEELCQYDVLLDNATGKLRQLNLMSQHEQCTVKVTPRLIVNDFQILKQAVEDGLGIAALPEYMCREQVNNGQLVEICPEWYLEKIDVYALYPKHRLKIPKVQALLDFVVDAFNQAL